METFVFHITEEQFNGLVKLSIMQHDQRGELVELRNGPYLEMHLPAQEIYDIMVAIDALGPDQKVFDQGEISETYCNVSYGYDQYQTSRGLH